MKLSSRIRAEQIIAMGFGFGLVMSLLPCPARTDQWNEKTIFTVNGEPVQVTGKVLLEPGQYTFKLLETPRVTGT